MFASMTSTLYTCLRKGLHLSRRARRSLPILALLLLASPVWGGDGLTLRVNDVKGAPGSLIAVEVRTYAPRGVGQGQICLFASGPLSNAGAVSFAGAEPFENGSDEGLQGRSPGSMGRDLTAPLAALRSAARTAVDSPAKPLFTLEGVVVLSALGDAVATSFFDAGTQLTMVDFASGSATINQADGPMLVLFFRLSEDLLPDQEYQIGLDPGHTFLVDEKGAEVPLDFKPGRLRITKPTDPSCPL